MGEQWRLSPLFRNTYLKMTGPELVIALGRTTLPQVQVIDGALTRTLTPIEAMALVANRLDFRGYGSARRVKRIERFTIEKPVAPWQSCWRTDGGSAAVLVRVAKPSQGYLGVTNYEL